LPDGQDARHHHRHRARVEQRGADGLYWNGRLARDAAAVLLFVRTESGSVRLRAAMTERDGPMTPKAFHALFGRIGARAKMQFPIHPHMLRHGCGYALANAGRSPVLATHWLQEFIGFAQNRRGIGRREVSYHGDEYTRLAGKSLAYEGDMGKSG
jgi:integrase